MFSEFPRKLGFPEQTTVNSIEKMLRMIDAANGYTNIYVSVFSDSQKIFGNLDKIAFDIDDCDGKCDKCKKEKRRKCSIGDLDIKPDSYNTFDNVIKLHEYFLEKRNIKHVIGFSGGGYHVYAKVDGRPLKNPNQALKNCAKNIVKETNIKADCSVFEIARIMRFPGTYNIKRQLWFVWVTEEDLQKGDKWIREKAEIQHIEPAFIWGERKIDLTTFDSEPTVELETIEIPEGITLENIKVPPCIQKALDDGYPGYHERYLIILYLKEKGVSFSKTIKILEQNLSVEKFIHCCQEERQPIYIYNNNNLFFPQCKTLAKEGFCVGKCPYWKRGSCVYLM